MWDLKISVLTLGWFVRSFAERHNHQSQVEQRARRQTLYKQCWLYSARLISERQRWAKYPMESLFQDEMGKL